MTILSVNKTRESDGRFAPIFCWVANRGPFLLEMIVVMKSKARQIAYAAIIAALYVVLTYAQNFLLPNTTSGAIQYRISEALGVLALFTPAAIPGFGIGCLIFNISNAGAMPLDIILGPLASVLAAWSMWKLRKVTVKGYPLVAMLMPAFWNGLLVGGELTYYFGVGFWINAFGVAVGELVVLITLGTVLFYVLGTRNLAQRIFGD